MPCSCPGSVPCVFVIRVGGYCLGVDMSVLCFKSLFCLYVYSGHYKDSTLLLFTHIVGRFFAREYLYIG